MTLTITKNNTLSDWSADLTEADLMRVIFAGLPIVFPGQAIPSGETDEPGDGTGLFAGTTQVARGRGDGIMTIIAIDEEPAA